jgi:hypothetical protein
MKILVLSDSHGDTRRLDAALEQNADAAAAFFLGDGVRDIEWLEDAYPKLPMYVVRGNCDFTSPYPVEGMVPFGGKNIFYTHGHLYNVKNSLDSLWQTAKARGADVALFGHTHKPLVKTVGGVLLFNPGAVGDYGLSGSYGLLTLPDASHSEDAPTVQVLPL